MIIKQTDVMATDTIVDKNAIEQIKVSIYDDVQNLVKNTIESNSFKNAMKNRIKVQKILSIYNMTKKKRTKKKQFNRLRKIMKKGK